MQKLPRLTPVFWFFIRTLVGIVALLMIRVILDLTQVLVTYFLSFLIIIILLLVAKVLDNWAYCSLWFEQKSFLKD